MSVLSQVTPMAADADQARREIMDEVGPYLDKAKARAVGNDILLAVYDRAGRKTAGGIIIAETNSEDKYQGKMALVLSLGPLCSEQKTEGYNDWFGGNPPKVGDWVCTNVRDGMSLVIGNTTCRLVEWKFLRLVAGVHDLVM